MFGLIFNICISAIDFGFDPEFQTKLEEHEKSYQFITEAINNKQIYTEPYLVHYYYLHGGAYSHSITKYRLVFKSGELKKIFQDCVDHLNTLYRQFIYNSLGDGFIWGIAYAIANKTANGKILNLKSGVGLLTGLFAMIVLQNSQAKPLPYYIESIPSYHAPTNCLYHGNDLRPNSLSRITVGLVGALISYIGTNCVINKENMQCLINIK